MISCFEAPASREAGALFCLTRNRAVALRHPFPAICTVALYQGYRVKVSHEHRALSPPAEAYQRRAPHLPRHSACKRSRKQRAGFRQATKPKTHRTDRRQVPRPADAPRSLSNTGRKSLPTGANGHKSSSAHTSSEKPATGKKKQFLPHFQPFSRHIPKPAGPHFPIFAEPECPFVVPNGKNAVRPPFTVLAISSLPYRTCFLNVAGAT